MIAKHFGAPNTNAATVHNQQQLLAETMLKGYGMK
jgi:hypothetical protein